ncbi:MAG TPA: PAS domain S-box protein, partial [Candidatus Binatia bacterium]|nr:PAS domain S-box protein [Candidatus Binatia bacterium]
MMSAFHAPPPHPAVEYRHQRICRSLALGAGAASFGTGLLALIGWAFAVPALTSIRPAFPSMKPITAICFMLSGGAMWLLRLHAGESRSDRTGQVLAARVIGVVVGLAGILTWFESRLGFSIGIDEVLFRAALRAGGAVNPGRMAAATALGFGFLGASLFLLEGPRPLRYLSQAFSLLAALNGMIGLVAYVYGQSALQQITPYNSMAVHTSILFVCLGIGLLASRPKFGFMAPITSQHIGGLMGRWLLPLVSILPIILGWLRWEGELAGHYNTAVGLVIFTVSTVIMLNLLLWASTFWLNRVDGQRRQALDRDVKLAAIVDSSEDAILSKDLDGTILSWNKGAEKLYGYSAAEVIGRPVYGIIPREYQEDALHFLEEVAQGRPVRREETARRHKDGSLVHVSLLVSPVRNAEGRIIGASSIAHDISERKRAEAALRESEERLRLFIEHAPAALAMFDRDMRYLQVSRRWRTDYGLSDRDLIGICHYEVFPDIPERWKDVHQRGLAGQILHMESDRFQRQDGSEQWLRWEVRPWRRRDGEIGGIVIFAEDITESTLSREQLAAQAQQLADTAAELFKSREALAEQARTLQSVLDNINDGLIAADSRGKFIIWNPAAYRILGKSRQDVPPEQWSEYYRVYLPDKVTPFPYEDLPLAKAI